MRDRGGALILGDGRRHMGLAKFGAELPCTVPSQAAATLQQYCWRHAGSGLVTRPRERRPLSGSGWGGHFCT